MKSRYQLCHINSKLVRKFKRRESYFQWQSSLEISNSQDNGIYLRSLFLNSETKRHYIYLQDIEIEIKQAFSQYNNTNMR